MQTDRIRQLVASAVVALSFGCAGDAGKQSKSFATADLDKTFVAILETAWNYYLRKEIFLGPTYFGNSTSFGRHSGSLHALALVSDYPTYRALATKGLIKLDELSLTDAPPGVFANGVRIERAAMVSLTDAGAKAGDVDKKTNTVTFVLGAYRVEKIALNTPVPTSDGKFQLVEGVHVVEVKPEFSDVWAELGWPTYRDRRFRVLFKFDTTDFHFKRLGQAWQVATASNGRFSAEDLGPRNGNFESENVPPTLDQLRLKAR